MPDDIPPFFPALCDFLREQTNEDPGAACPLFPIRVRFRAWLETRGMGPAPSGADLKRALRRAGFDTVNRRQNGSDRTTLFVLDISLIPRD